MIAALLFTASVPTAVDAEFAFARDAHRNGQWTAFRKWADKDAVVFNPQATSSRTRKIRRSRSAGGRATASCPAMDGQP